MIPRGISASRSLLGAVLLLALAVAAPAQARMSVTASPAAVTLAPGQTETVTLSGTAGPIAVAASEPIVTIAIDSRTPALMLTARTVGHTVVRVSDGSGAGVDIPIDILPGAGSVPGRIRLTITGDPATPEFIAARITAALASAIGPTLTAGSSIHTAAVLPAPQTLGSGFLTSFRVPITIAPGAGALAVTGTTSIDVENAALPGFQPVELSFRDDPERITADGVLSRTKIDVTRPTRIYYYHENMRAARRFCVVLSSNDSVVTRVHIVGAVAGPNVDVMSVGHAVSKSFLTLQPHNEGVVVDIAGGRPYLERDSPVGPGEGIVGSIDVRVLAGGPVTATIMAIPLGAEPPEYLYAPKLPDDGHTRHGSFDLTDFAQRSIGYTAGGSDATYTYGNRRQTLQNSDPADPGRDYGDYGVLQHVAFDLDNPGDVPVTLYLYEKPLGGVVRSSFVVNGEVVELGCVRVARRYLVTSLALAPHATGVLDVLTMTDGGSNYPLELGVTAIPPQAATPSISAADGCFPKRGGTPAAPQPANGPPGQ